MNIESDYPQKADELIFYCDMPIEQSSMAAHYHEQLLARNYTAASRLLKENTEHYYGADLFNLMENRLESLQTHLKSKPKINPHKYSRTKPDALNCGDMWIGEGE